MTNGKKVDTSEVRKRGYKLLLYADNKQHMRVLSRIRRSEELRKYYCGCWHVLRDQSGAEIVTGHDKKHCHIILDFPNARYWSSVCKQLDLSEQFCRPIGLYHKSESVERGYVYLCHANAPDKEQYPVSALWGASEKVAAASAAIVAYQMGRVSLAQSLGAIRDWIVSKRGRRITPTMFVDWVVKTPYVKGASNPWVRQMIDSHNFLVSQKMGEFYADEAQNWDDWLKSHGWEEIV